MSHYSAIIRIRLSEDDLGQARATAQELAELINNHCLTDCTEVLEVNREEEAVPLPASPAVEVLSLPACGIPGCTQTASFEGWAHKVDPCTGQTSGMMRMLKACEEHKLALIGFQDVVVEATGE